MSFNKPEMLPGCSLFAAGVSFNLFQSWACVPVRQVLLFGCYVSVHIVQPPATLLTQSGDIYIYIYLLTQIAYHPITW